DDVALSQPVNRAVRLLDKARQALGLPVVAACLALVAIHALLHHRPADIVGHEEPMQVELKAILHGGAVALATTRLARHTRPASKPMRSQKTLDSSGVRRECLPRP